MWKEQISERLEVDPYAAVHVILIDCPAKSDPEGVAHLRDDRILYLP